MASIFLLVIILLMGVATRQIAYTLIYGSIFTRLRNGVKKMYVVAPEGSWKKWGFELLNELLSCNVCLTTEVAIWFWALPITIAVHSIWSHPLEILAGKSVWLGWEIAAGVVLFFMLFAAIAALAMLFWVIMDRIAKPGEAQVMYYKEQINLARELAAAQLEENKGERKKLSFESFIAMIGELDHCQFNGCSAKAKQCRDELIPKLVEKYCAKCDAHICVKLKLLTKLPKLFDLYYASRKANEGRLVEYQKEFFALL